MVLNQNAVLLAIREGLLKFPLGLQACDLGRVVLPAPSLS